MELRKWQLAEALSYTTLAPLASVYRRSPFRCFLHSLCHAQEQACFYAPGCAYVVHVASFLYHFSVILNARAVSRLLALPMSVPCCSPVAPPALHAAAPNLVWPLANAYPRSGALAAALDATTLPWRLRTPPPDGSLGRPSGAAIVSPFCRHLHTCAMPSWRLFAVFISQFSSGSRPPALLLLYAAWLLATSQCY